MVRPKTLVEARKYSAERVDRMSNNSRIPSYRRHKQSGQAIVTLPDGLGGRHDVLLGLYGTKESRVEYARVIAEWEAAGRMLSQTPATSDPTVNELMLAYWKFAERYYVKNGKPTSQLPRIRLALKPLKQLYGHTAVRNFGPLALKAVREWMIKQGWSRGFINACSGCIKRMFKWGVENELAPPSIYHGLQAVAGLRKGRSEATETQPVRPVIDEHVEAALPFVSRAVQAMIQVQRLSGARPGEVALMRPCDIDQSSESTWVYRPESHKTEHHGIARVIFLGPQAQEILKPFLLRDPGAYLFSPREMMQERWAKQRKARKTKVQPSQQNRKRRKPRKILGEHYTVASYDRAVAKACQRAGVPHWHPNQLRHAKATELRREAGLDAARVVLGHRSPQVTEVYAELDVNKAAEVMGRLG
jgi:integrase